MAHYKNNNNKTSFIPTENKKKKKKFTKEQLIVFILMIFWSISSVLGIVAFTSNVVKAEEPLTVYAEEPDYNYSPPKYNDVNYNEFNPCKYPTMNLLGAQYMVNESFTTSETTLGTKYTLTRTADSFVSEWFYNPFTYLYGTYTACIRNFHYSSYVGTAISLQFQSSNNVNFYVRFKNNTGQQDIDLTANFTFENIDPSLIVRCRFICSNSYPVGQSFSFYAPVLYHGDTNYPYSPYFGTYCDIASDYAYEKGWQDSGEAYNDGYDKGYDDGFSKAQEEFEDKYGIGDLGILSDASVTINAYRNNLDNISNRVEYPRRDLIGTNGLDFSSYLTSEEWGYVPIAIELQITPNWGYFNYSQYPLFSYDYPDKKFNLVKEVLNENGDLEPLVVSTLYTSHGLASWNPVAINNLYELRADTYTSEDTLTSFLPDVSYNYISVFFFPGETAALFSVDFFSGTSFNLGYDKGLEDAFSSAGYLDALKSAQDKGEAIGYNKGVKDANSYSFLGLMGAVVDAPLNAFIRMFDFDILGFNMKSLYLSLFTACLLIVIVKKVI